MKCVAVNTNIRMFYKTDVLTTGQPVLFNVWDDSSVKLIDNQPPTSEVGSEGIYYYEFSSPSTDCYILVIASNNGQFPEAQVMKIGDPPEKVFYVQGNFEAGKDISYEIYDSSNAVLSSGNLTNIIYGFYSADSEGLPKPWFFEVFPWVVKDNPCVSPQ